MNGIIHTTDTSVQNEITPDMYVRYINYIDASEKTIETYTRALRQFTNYLHINNITAPDRETVIQFREYLKNSGHKPATIQNYLTVVKLFFQWTEQEKIYPDIAEHIKAPKIDKGHKKDYLTSNQVKTILDSLNRQTLGGCRDYAIILLMITCGLRTIEIVRADYKDIGKIGDSTVLYIQGKGKEEKNDFVKLCLPVENAIRNYLKMRKNVKDSEPLFASIANKNKGERMTTRSISRIIKDRMCDAGFNSDRLTAHSLRHTTATLNLINGGSLEETQQLLRHTNINTTMIYTHLLDKTHNNSSERIAKSILKD